MSRGYFGIGIYQPKTEANVGTLWRSAHAFEADFLYVIGRRFKRYASDTVKAWKHIPFYEYQTFEEFYATLPFECRLVMIECPSETNLRDFSHPERACYLLGSEDNGLPEAILKKAHFTVQIESRRCLNVATAGSITMFHRIGQFS